MIKEMVLQQTFGSDSYQGQVHAPDFWILRDTSRRIINSGCLSEFLGYDEQEKEGTMPGALTDHDTMNTVFERPLDEEMLKQHYTAFWSSDPLQITDFPWAMLHQDGSTVFTLMTIRATTLDGCMSAFTFCRVIPEDQWRKRLANLRKKAKDSGQELSFIMLIKAAAMR